MKPAIVINEDFSGNGPHVLELNPGYADNQIEIIGSQNGAYTFRAWGRDGDGYGNVEGGDLTFPTSRTLTIKGYFLERIEITPPGSGSFGVRGLQSAPPV